MVFVANNRSSLLEVWHFIKKETLAEVFSCEFCETIKNTYFYRTPLVAASLTNFPYMSKRQSTLFSINLVRRTIWDKVFKSGPRKTCGRQPLKNLKGYGLVQADHTPSNFLKAVFHKFYSVHSWILCPIFLFDH